MLALQSASEAHRPGGVLGQHSQTCCSQCCSSVPPTIAILVQGCWARVEGHCSRGHVSQQGGGSRGPTKGARCLPGCRAQPNRKTKNE